MFRSQPSIFLGLLLILLVAACTPEMIRDVPTSLETKPVIMSDSTAEVRAVIEEEAIEEYREIISSKIKAGEAKSAMELSVANLDKGNYVDSKILDQIRRHLRVLYEVG